MSEIFSVNQCATERYNSAFIKNYLKKMNLNWIEYFYYPIADIVVNKVKSYCFSKKFGQGFMST